jgi:hypothetical protein
MIAQLRDGMLVVTSAAGAMPADWLGAHAGQVFRLRALGDGSAQLQSLGPEAEACRVPINITSQSAGPLRLVSNFTHTPFRLDGQGYIPGVIMAAIWTRIRDGLRPTEPGEPPTK